MRRRFFALFFFTLDEQTGFHTEIRDHRNRLIVAPIQKVYRVYGVARHKSINYYQLSGGVVYPDSIYAVS